MTWLASLPAGVLVAAWSAFALAVAAVSRIAVRAVVPAAERDHVPVIAAPLMPALGATFAVLMALTLASEATNFRSAQDIVSTEAAQASRLAWAATNVGVETAAIQDALTDYLRATRANEWRDAGSGENQDATTARAIAKLENIVRTEAVALIVNAGALAFRSSVRTSVLVAGLAIVVALSLALLFALTAPWSGPIIVSGEPIDAIVRDLNAGFFRG